jgi:hypothetical protein
MKLEIRIPYPTPKSKWSEFGDNAYYKGKHWAQRRGDAEYWHGMMLIYAPWTEPPLAKPVRLIFSWNDNLDLDNHSIWAKMMTDGIKKRIIADDNRKHVKEIVHRFHDGDYIRIQIEEVDDDSK